MSFMAPIPDASSIARPTRGCQGCRDGIGLPFAFTMAFQPIVDVAANRVWAYEALVRGTAGQSARTILDQVGTASIYGFDQACRVKAVELAGKLFPRDGDIRLSINFMPNAVYQPDACIRATLNAARQADFRQDRLMFEFTENEQMRDTGHVRNIVEAYRRRGFTTAIDDFGAGYAGLGLLAELRPDVVKMDMALIRGIDESATKRAIVRAIVAMAYELQIDVIAEGIETTGELATLRGLGIRLCQGYLLARPAIEALPAICW